MFSSLLADFDPGVPLLRYTFVGLPNSTEPDFCSPMLTPSIGESGTHLGILPPLQVVPGQHFNPGHTTPQKELGAIHPPKLFCVAGVSL